MQAFPISPGALLAAPWRHRQLLARLVHRDVVGRYRGSLIGLGWSFFNPLFMLAVYTFVFGTIFKARWPSTSGGHDEFAVVLFCGLVVFGLFSECFTRAPQLVLEQPNFVKKIVFPLEVLPWVALGGALFHLSVGLLVLVPAVWWVRGAIPLTAVLVPFALAPLILLVLGLGWFLGALGVFLRDIGQAIGLLSSALMFLSPVFYSLDTLPPSIGTVLAMSPLAFAIEAVRDLLIWGRTPNLYGWAIHTVMCALIAWLGFVWFQKTRRGFGDVL